MKNFFYKTILAVLIFLLLYFSLAIEEIIQPKYVLATVTSGSMEDTIKTGAVVVLKRYGNNCTPSVGEIAIFENKDIFGPDSGNIIHRIVSVDEKSAITKGDHNSYEDGATSLSSFKYKAILIINAASYLYNFFHIEKIVGAKPVVIAVKIIVPIICTFTLIYIYKMLKEERRKEKQNIA